MRQATHPQEVSSMAVEVGPEGHVLLVLRLRDQLAPAVIGFDPSDAAALAKEISTAAHDAASRRRLVIHG